jgi:hypothetical protein
MERDGERREPSNTETMNEEALKIKRNVIDFTFKVRMIHGVFLNVIEEELLQ